MRSNPRQDHALAHRGQAQLPGNLRALQLRRPAAGRHRQRRQGHRLEDPGGSRPARQAQLPQARRLGQGPAETGLGSGCRGDDPRPGAGNQRPGGGEGLGGAVEDHRARPHPPGAAQGRGEDPLPRPGGTAAQDHLQPHLVGPGGRARQLQRVLHQRPRADPLAHPHWPPAVLPGPPLDARLRREPDGLSPAHRHQGHRQRRRTAQQRQSGDRPELDHPAPEMGHPLHLQRQPADADPVARRAYRVDVRGRRAGHRRGR
ncbi:hypothetical protein D3C76_822640 [compost metagenome]